MIQEKYTSAEVEAILKEARYHLGRVLYEGELDFNEAVSNLEKADREDPAVMYYLGQAIRAQVESNLLARAERLLREYLERGAPLGREEQVREFLGVRRGARAMPVR